MNRRRARVFSRVILRAGLQGSTGKLVCLYGCDTNTGKLGLAHGTRKVRRNDLLILVAVGLHRVFPGEEVLEVDAGAAGDATQRIIDEANVQPSGGCETAIHAAE